MGRITKSAENGVTYETAHLASVSSALPYVAGAAVAFAGYAGYASMAARSQFFGETFTQGSNPRQLALTYDDGPNDPHTLRLLDVLAEQGVKATFFVMGRYAAHRPDILRRIAEEGHVIGNHTYSHPNLVFCTASRVAQEIEDCRKAISDAIGDHSRLFRPPFGGRRPAVLRVIREKGLQPIMWSITSYDWRASARAENIEPRVYRQIIRHHRNVILMHDGGHLSFGADRGHTVIASKQLIRRCKGEGYGFVTISEMLTRSSCSAPS